MSFAQKPVCMPCGPLFLNKIAGSNLRMICQSRTCVSRQRAPCLLSIVIAASCALLFAIATDELFNGLNLNGEIAVGLCVEGPVLLNIWEFPHKSRQ
jgi:hypothetical protein